MKKLLFALLGLGLLSACKSSTWQPPPPGPYPASYYRAVAKVVSNNAAACTSVVLALESGPITSTTIGKISREDLIYFIRGNAKAWERVSEDLRH